MDKIEDFDPAGVRRLIDAVLLRAAEDYRKAAFYEDAVVMRDLERFFDDLKINKQEIEKINQGATEFRDRLFKFEFVAGGKKKHRRFICPLCGGSVDVSVTKRGDRKGLCAGCGMSGTIYQGLTRRTA